MYFIYKSLKKGTIWAGNNTIFARSLIICISTIMISVGYLMGYELFSSNYEFPLFLPFLIIGITLLLPLLVSANPFNRKGERKSAQKLYFHRIIRYSVYSYCTFLMAICCGNYEYNTIYSFTDAVNDWSSYVNSANPDQYTSVEIIHPPVERVQKKNLKKIKSKKRWSWRKLKMQNKKPMVTTQKGQGVFILVAILFIMLSLVIAVFSCLAFCTEQPWGYALGILGIVSFIWCLLLSIYYFNVFARSKDEKGKERVKKEKKVRGGRKSNTKKAIKIE